MRQSDVIAALRDTRLSPYQRIFLADVLIEMGDRASVEVDIDDVCDRLSIARSTIEAGITRLCFLGLIEVAWAPRHTQGRFVGRRTGGVVTWLGRTATIHRNLFHRHEPKL
jgi:hypothetical protein